MKISEILEMQQSLYNCKDLKGVTFSLAIAKNVKLINKEVETINEELTKLKELHAEKDSENKPLIENGNYVMTDLESFNKDIREFFNIENEITLHKIKEVDLPVDITAGQLTGIFDLIDLINSIKE